MISTIKTTAIAAGASFAIGAVSAWWVTADYKEAKYTAVLAQMKQDAAEALVEAQKKALEIERENNRLAQEIEVQNAKFKQAIFCNDRVKLFRLGKLQWCCGFGRC